MEEKTVLVHIFVLRGRGLSDYLLCYSYKFRISKVLKSFSKKKFTYDWAILAIAAEISNVSVITF